jgi:hypothetical protein
LVRAEPAQGAFAEDGVARGSAQIQRFKVYTAINRRKAVFCSVQQIVTLCRPGECAQGPLALAVLRNNSEEKERGENDEVNHALQERGAPRAERDYTHEERQRQEHGLLAA